MSVKRKKPNADFEIYLQGVYPEEVPFRAVADAVSSIQRMIRPEQEEAESSVRVFDILRGSAVYRCVASDTEAAIQRLRLVGERLSCQTVDDLLGEVFPSIHKLSEVAQQTRSTIIVRRSVEDRKEVLAVIQPDTYAALKSAHTVCGSAVLFGELKRVGGITTPRCMIRAQNQRRTTYCDVTRDQARELAPRLYGDVAVEGQATWLRATWDIIEFRINRVLPYRGPGFAEARKRLREAGASRWDNASAIEELSVGE